MQGRPARLEGVIQYTPLLHKDERGYVFESFRTNVLAGTSEQSPTFVQENCVYSRKGALRGLHYQLRQQQGKLITVLQGNIYDVVVDMRPASSTFGQWEAFELTAQATLWIPAGCAHGFKTISHEALVCYKLTDYYAPQHERCLAWNDRTLNIEWPKQELNILSTKDQQGQDWATCIAEICRT